MEKLTRNHDGSYLYAYDIKVDSESQTETATIVRVWPHGASLPTANDITAAVIADRWSANGETKIVNDYNAAQLGIFEDEEAEAAIEAYKAYLRERKRLKKMVAADAKELGLR